MTAEPFDSVDLPYITTDQMREVDRLMVDEYGITLFQMMENAGRALARFSRDRFLDGDAKGKRVLVLVGPGGNGGGGMVCARNLHNWGAVVQLLTSFESDSLGEVPTRQLHILDGLGVPLTLVSGANDLPDADLVIDALIGYSLNGPPRGPVASLIRAANDANAPRLALDTPSGINLTTGTTYDPAIVADATLTLALPKQGLRADEAVNHVGELWLADIGVPPELYVRSPIGMRIRSPFSRNDIVRIA